MLAFQGTTGRKASFLMSTCTRMGLRRATLLRSFQSTCQQREEADAAALALLKEKKREERKHRKLMAQDYNNRRAAYNRQVSLLRKQYFAEAERNRKADMQEDTEKRERMHRKKLERQRLKNIKSAQNAIRQEEVRKEREREFQKHLEQQQIIRDAQNEQMRIARQLLVDELEEEAKDWMTTTEEMEKAFTHEAEQLLWARPGGTIGAKNPSLDAHFWNIETHTWHMNKTYRTRRQILLEQVEEDAYNRANIDPKIWTPERIREHEEIEEKARLRSMVNAAGKSSLLRKQKSLIEADAAEGPIPKQMAVPSFTMLNKDSVVETEGARLLMEDPTKFFVFQNQNPAERREQHGFSNEDEKKEGVPYSGPTLGMPIALRDPLREEHGTVYPEYVGLLEKPDTRTEKEKKQAEREERLRAAAETAKKEAGEAVAEEEDDDEALGPEVDYEAADRDSDDEEWERGLDPVLDADKFQTPKQYRYTQDDHDWVKEQIENKVVILEEQFGQDMEALKEEMKAEKRAQASSPDEQEFEDGTLEAALLALSDKELMALSDLDERYAENALSDTELAEAAKDIPGLTEEQLKQVLTRDREDDQ